MGPVLGRPRPLTKRPGFIALVNINTVEEYVEIFTYYRAKKFRTTFSQICFETGKGYYFRHSGEIFYIKEFET